jgi:aminocarboxymuconate-semialdehyde decarboxylase
MGSDYPFLLRETPPGRVINQMDINKEMKEAILGKNALKFLNIKEADLLHGKQSIDSRR